MKCLNTNKYSTLLLKLNSLMSPVGTLDELTEYLELCYKLVEVDKNLVIKDLIKLKERYLKSSDKLVHYNLVQSLIETLEDSKYQDSRTLFNNIYRLVKPNKDNYYLVFHILKEQSLIEEAINKFRDELYDKDLSKEDNINLFVNHLSGLVSDFILHYADIAAYVTAEFLEYCTHTYVKEYFNIVLKVNDKLEYESLELNIKD